MAFDRNQIGGKRTELADDEDGRKATPTIACLNACDTHGDYEEFRRPEKPTESSSYGFRTLVTWT